jgi:hypothetical protein
MKKLFVLFEDLSVLFVRRFPLFPAVSRRSAFRATSRFPNIGYAPDDSNQSALPGAAANA